MIVRKEDLGAFIESLCGDGPEKNLTVSFYRSGDTDYMRILETDETIVLCSDEEIWKKEGAL